MKGKGLAYKLLAFTSLTSCSGEVSAYGSEQLSAGCVMLNMRQQLSSQVTYRSPLDLVTVITDGNRGAVT